jgi:hypothetical protein
MEQQQEYEVELLLDGKKVGLNPYVRSVFHQVVKGLVSTLKNTGDPEEILVRVSTAKESGRTS